MPLLLISLITGLWLHEKAVAGATNHEKEINFKHTVHPLLEGRHNNPDFQHGIKHLEFLGPA